MLTQVLGRVIRERLGKLTREMARTPLATTLRTFSGKASKRPLLFSSVGAGLLMAMPMLSFSTARVAYASGVESISETSVFPTSILSTVPSDKATVGVIPYVVKQGQVYLLLGRERMDGTKKERAGKFSDFGGSVELDGTTLLQNLIRELKEESMKRIEISEKDLLAKGKVIYKRSSKNREIFYVLYPMSEEEYAKTQELNALWPVLCASRKEASECEKDQFVWFKAQDILHKTKQAEDIEGGLHTVQLREYFVQDCIEHPAFAKVLGEISQPKSKSKAANVKGMLKQGLLE